MIVKFIIITPIVKFYKIKKSMLTSGFNTSFGNPNQYTNLNHSDKKSLPEYKKIFCAYHAT